MKVAIFILPMMVLVACTNGQTAFVKKNEKDGGKFWVVVMKSLDERQKTYWPSCYFKDVTSLEEGVKLSLIKQILDEIESDTTKSYKTVEALSYRYNGRHNKSPKSTHYNIQVAGLILINYLAFSSDAVEYSPFPVLVDKTSKKEFTTSGKELTDVIYEYRKWFDLIKINGFNSYTFPLISNKYEWFGSLYITQRTYDKIPVWSNFYNCPSKGNYED